MVANDSGLIDLHAIHRQAQEERAEIDLNPPSASPVTTDANVDVDQAVAAFAPPRRRPLVWLAIGAVVVFGGLGIAAVTGTPQSSVSTVTPVSDPHAKTVEVPAVAAAAAQIPPPVAADPAPPPTSASEPSVPTAKPGSPDPERITKAKPKRPHPHGVKKGSSGPKLMKVQSTGVAPTAKRK